jgi:hypothetical protein
MRTRLHIVARCTATLLVALWASQPLGLLAHAAETHAHRFCPEHRTFEEAARGSGQLVSQRSEAAPSVSTRAPAVADTARSTHEACPLLTAGSREETPAAEVETVTALCLAVSRPATAPPLRARSSLSVLATAPKSSPPARA